jgi:hypothetical protein
MKDRSVILYLREWVRDWHSYETLLHEIVHAVQYIFEDCRGLWSENEAVAYQIEYLFRSIRRKLDRVDKVKIVKL